MEAGGSSPSTPTMEKCKYQRADEFNDMDTLEKLARATLMAGKEIDWASLKYVAEILDNQPENDVADLELCYVFK